MTSKKFRIVDGQLRLKQRKIQNLFDVTDLCTSSS